MQHKEINEQCFRMDAIAFAVHSQRLEDESLSPDEVLRLQSMLRRGMTPDEGIAYLKQELGVTDEVRE